jgi:hypothetical protein
MAHTPAPRFLAIENIGIVNTEDISTALPYRKDGLRVNLGDDYDGLRLTFMSKGTSVDLPGQTIGGFATVLDGAVF